MPRKTAAAEQKVAATMSASMRPRPDAAENRVQLVLGAQLRAASMRPRPDAAENIRDVLA